ncbi:MAG TPA: SPOR domain-containing protein [Gammaproteobacteria bacterium]|nr:SPOR domain-containing protein [Gammaproteobacteria bacterium]
MPVQAETVAPKHKESLENSHLIHKFSNKKDAEALLYKLIASGQPAEIIKQTKNFKLKSLSVGLYSDEKTAQSVVKHLKTNHVDAFPFRVKSGKYRVHAGAMQEESHYWKRFELLLSLGYKHIRTTLEPTTLTEFLVVRKLGTSVLTKQTPSQPATKPKDKAFNTRLLSGRFKGEFYRWNKLDEQNSSNYFSASLSARTGYKNRLDLTYGFRFEALNQISSRNVQRVELQFLPTYVRFQKPDKQWHIGLIDGRWDERNQPSLADRISSKVLTRYQLDEALTDRRQALAGIRLQLQQSPYRLDVIVNPLFRAAKLPSFNSIWHPVNQLDGTMLGIRPTDDWRELIRKGNFAKEKIQTGGLGIRMSQQSGSSIRATTAQYVRQSEPYYALSSEIQQQLNTGSSVDEALAASNSKTFSPQHPYSAIFTWEASSKTSHFELAVSSNTPYTTTKYQMKTAVSLEWVLGLTRPGKQTYLSGYFVGRRINTRDDMLDRKTKLALQGDAYYFLYARHWKIGTSYRMDIDSPGLYLNPKINYEQNKYLRFSLFYQLFTGSKNTASGFHREHALLGLNWQATL